MKKLLLILLLMMSVLVVNAQASQNTTTTAKSVKTTIKVVDLQKAITDKIAKEYAGFTIKKAQSVEKNNIVTYHVVIVKDTIKETLVYDKDGKFVKMYHQKDVKQQSSKKK